MRVFISYGSAGDQALALRVQALAAVSGLTVYVPPAYTRGEATASLLAPEVHQKLFESNVVLGIIASQISPACSQELHFGLTSRKHIIVMAYPGLEATLGPAFIPNLVTVDPQNPAAAELAIVQHLKSRDSQSANGALIALATLTLGLLLFASVKKD